MKNKGPCLILAVTLVSLLFAGCATSPLPKGARLVGGGLAIEYEAPENGTVILVEHRSGRKIATQSLAQGASFKFGPDWSDSKEVLRSMYAPPGDDSDQFPRVPPDAHFDLYFVPQPE